jgi:pyruvate,water dikinase
VTPYARPLQILGAADEPAFGGKSTSLGELIGAGVNVPPGFAVSTAAFEAFLKAGELGDGIRARLHGLDAADIAAVNRAATDVHRLMAEMPVPADVRAVIAASYRTLGEEAGISDPPVAVRSSARGEDSAEATFAGQQETYLWVKGFEGVCAALRSCWISLYSPTAIVYRAVRLAEDSPPAMGVTVQLMVDAAVSGVMFTCSPLTGDPSVIAINASWGLGLAVVGGDVTPDDIVVSKVTREVLRRTTSSKLVEYVPDPSGPGAHRVQVALERQDAPCLTDEQLPPLVDLARRVEQFFGSRQDIEWAIGRSGEYPANLYALQARPVTVTGAVEGGPSTDRAGASAMSLLLGTFGVRPEDG